MKQPERAVFFLYLEEYSTKPRFFVTLLNHCDLLN